VTGNPTRRDLLTAAAVMLVSRDARAAKQRLAKSSVAAITDEMGSTQTGAIAFAKRYALQWVVLRAVPETKREFALLSEPELMSYAAQLDANKLKVSLLKTSATRKEDLAKGIAAARILGAGALAVPTGARVARPESVYPRIVQDVEALIPLAEAAKIRLAIENDSMQNVGTAAELKTIIALLPSKTIGFNWDPREARAVHETPWPTGYSLLPKARMLNVQVNAAGLGGGPNRIDWRSILETMRKDGFRGEICLETGISGGDFENANDFIEDLLHIVGEAA